MNAVGLQGPNPSAHIEAHLDHSHIMTAGAEVELDQAVGTRCVQVKLMQKVAAEQAKMTMAIVEIETKEGVDQPSMKAITDTEGLQTVSVDDVETTDEWREPREFADADRAARIEHQNIIAAGGAPAADQRPRITLRSRVAYHHNRVMVCNQVIDKGRDWIAVSIVQQNDLIVGEEPWYNCQTFLNNDW